MALKDLKSDLSKFRRPIDKPLIEQKRVEIPKGPNQTPLSQFVDRTPAAPKSNLTTPKQGVTPNKFDNSSNFLGETTQNQFDNSPNYLGETTPTKMSLKERFLGQTEPNIVQQGDKFKGETETANITQGDRFKGETTPKEYSNAEKFKGETSPTEFKFVKQFLGETDTKNSNLSPKFLGETNTTDVIQGDKFKGETNTTLITYDPKLEKQAKDPQYVDFFTNEDAWGFSPLQKHKSPSKFRGVDISQTNFDGTTSLYGLNTPTKYNEQSVVSKLDSKYDFTKAVNYNVDLQLDNGLRKSYTDNVLKKEYNRFNLKQDSPNNWFIKHPLILTGIQTKKGEPFTYGYGGLSFIRGGAVASTTRAAFDAARIAQMLLTPRGLIWGLKQIGMQRANAYGKTWTPINLLANVVSQHIGLRWDRPGVIPIGDESWKYGFKAGVIKVAEKQSRLAAIVASKAVGVDDLNSIYSKFTKSLDSDNFVIKEDLRGGPDSFYGIGKTQHTRKYNSFTNSAMTYGDAKANFVQKYFPFGGYDVIGGIKNYGYESDIKKDKNGNVIKTTEAHSPIPIDEKFERMQTLWNQDASPLSSYQGISYGQIQKMSNARAGKEYSVSDFRDEYKGGIRESVPVIDELSYDKQPRRSYYGLQNLIPSDVRWAKNSAKTSHIWDSNYNDLMHDPGDSDWYDIYTPVDSTGKPSLVNDFVHMFFAWDNDAGRQDSKSIVQFRSTISGLTETLSPTWNGIKYPGRADKSYMYEEFERTLSFNFKVYAESRGEFEIIWRKLNELQQMTYPSVGRGTYTGTICYFRLGHLYGNGINGHPSLITSLTYTFPDDLGWETNQDGTLFEAPLGVDVSISLTLLPKNGYYSKTKDEYGFFYDDINNVDIQKLGLKPDATQEEIDAAITEQEKKNDNKTKRQQKSSTRVKQQKPASTPKTTTPTTPTTAPSKAKSNVSVKDAQIKAEEERKAKEAADRKARQSKELQEFGQRADYGPKY